METSETKETTQGIIRKRPETKLAALFGHNESRFTYTSCMIIMNKTPLY